MNSISAAADRRTDDLGGLSEALMQRVGRHSCGSGVIACSAAWRAGLNAESTSERTSTRTSSTAMLGAIAIASVAAARTDVGDDQHVLEARAIDPGGEERPGGDVGQGEAHREERELEGAEVPDVDDDRDQGDVVEPVGEVGGGAAEEEPPLSGVGKEVAVAGHRRFLVERRPK